MKLLLAIVLIIVISILGSRITFLNRKLSLGFRNILLTGTEYIFIGAFLGGMGINVLDADALNKLEPFLVFGLCWVGFLFGLQFQVRQLKTLPRSYLLISAAQAFITFLMVTVSMVLALKRFSDLPDTVILMAAVTFGSAASCTAQSALAIVGKNYRFKNRRLLDLMRYISGVDGIYALCFFAAALSIFPGVEIAGFNFFKSLEWLFVSAALGIIPALILIYLNKVRFSPQEFLVFLVGTVILCGGLAHQIGYSPLISGFVCGVMTANFCRHRLRALSTVLHAEKSIYISLLLFLGAGWQFKPDKTLIITGIYFLVRIVGKFTGTFTASRVFKTGFAVPPTIGLGLISEGGLGAAVIINFKLLYPAVADPLITIIVLSVFVNELLSPWFILGRFDKRERFPLKR